MRSALFSLTTCFLLTLSAPLPALGQQRRDNQPSDRPEGEAEVAKAIDGFTQALGRLETRLSHLETEVEVVDVGQQSSDPWQTFPTVSDGIETVGVVVEFSVERQTNQSNGSGTLWHWDGRAADGDASHVRWLVPSDGTVQPLLEMTESRTKISGKSGPFAALGQAGH